MLRTANGITTNHSRFYRRRELYSNWIMQMDYDKDQS